MTEPRTLGTTGLRVSRLGFGCYRVDDQTPEHRQALERAIDSGCTLIDTSTNYTDGGSERLVGQVLAGLDKKRRGAITLVSKIGYVQGSNLEIAAAREKEGRPFPGMVRYMDGCWHCVHPEFLRDQLTRSRERLGIDTLDVCLLHNPEYFLADAKKRGADDLEATRDEFYRRLGEAFAFLEERVSAGEIRFYGVSSNTAVAPADDPEATSLSRMLAAAATAGAEHHFRVLQIPMNLFETGGALTRNTGPGYAQTALEAAAEAGVGVLINRPLNAFAGDRLVRLADAEAKAAEAPLLDLAAGLDGLAGEHRRDFAAHLPPEGARAAEEFFGLIAQVVDLAERIEDPIQWRQIEQQYVIPRINMMAGGVARAVDSARQPLWRAWWERYLPPLQGLLQETGRRAAVKSREANDRIAALLDPALPPERRRESLSRKALWVVASTPGVSCVLVGMRRGAYVEDAMGIAEWPPLADPIGAYRRLAPSGGGSRPAPETR